MYLITERCPLSLSTASPGMILMLDNLLPDSYFGQLTTQNHFGLKNFRAEILREPGLSQFLPRVATLPSFISSWFTAINFSILLTKQ